MVSKESVDKQLKALGFNHRGWGRAEVGELYNILLPDEELYELVNGFYDGGFALLVATDVRVLLVDKKPLNYLTVEDLRFDMINEMDYNHRLLGANIIIATGNKTLKFTSLNQQRLRKVIGHVQHCMAESKKTATSHQEDQKTHLEQINQQLQAYLVAQHQNQIQMQQIQQMQQAGMAAPPVPEPVKPSPELADYLFAQSLLAQYQAQTGITNLPPLQQPAAATRLGDKADPGPQMNELYAEGMQEIFGKRDQLAAAAAETPQLPRNPLDVNPIAIAYSKLPMALRNRKFGRPSFHAHSAATPPPQPVQPTEAV